MIKKEDIKHIADLARLELSEEEVSEMGAKIPDILKMVEELNEVDTSGVEPTAQVTGLEGVTREDDSMPWDREELNDALDQAPHKKGDEFKVKRVLK